MDRDNLKWLMRDVSEKAFQAQVIQAARLTGWLCYHTLRSTGSEPGFPDLVCVRGDGTGVYVLELKSERGKPTPAQRRWIEAFQANGIDADIKYPHNIDEIIERLQR